MSDVELRRMPHGESCSNCGSRKWYLLDGLRYCARGHQIEGYIQLGAGEEQDAGLMGATSRRVKERREIDEPQLSGREARLLYLEAVQLVLRNEILWLINGKGHREELETVVRDLWDLRIRGFDPISPDDEAAMSDTENTGEVPSQPSSPHSLSGGRNAESKAKPWARAQDWGSSSGEWPLPTMLDSLALCYLGCLLLRIPTRVSQICRWANNEGLPYRRAFYDLPQTMRKRMSPKHTASLKQPLYRPVETDLLYKTVMGLVVSYHANYEMVFPDINHIPILVQLVQMLALPIESVIVTRELSSILDYRFRFPINSNRINPLDYPEIRLAALIIIATKLCFPLTGAGSHLDEGQSKQTPRFNWELWQRGMQKILQERKPAGANTSFDDVTTDQVVAMSDQELSEYFAQVSSAIHHNNEHSIAKFFPAERPPSPTLLIPEHPKLQDEKMRRLLHDAMESTEGNQIEHEDEQDPPRTNTTYEAFREVKDLTGVALTLYTAVGDVIDVPLESLVRTVYVLEQRIRSYQKKEKKQILGAEHEGDMLL